MAQINKIGIKNFRIFKEYNEFEIKPLTVLIGPNNSGKSTLIKSILLLKENLIRQGIPYLLQLKSDDFDLGSIQSLANNPLKPISIRIPIDLILPVPEVYLDLSYIHNIINDRAILNEISLNCNNDIIFSVNNIEIDFKEDSCSLNVNGNFDFFFSKYIETLKTYIKDGIIDIRKLENTIKEKFSLKDIHDLTGNHEIINLNDTCFKYYKNPKISPEDTKDQQEESDESLKNIKFYFKYLGIKYWDSIPLEEEEYISNNIKEKETINLKNGFTIYYDEEDFVKDSFFDFNIYLDNLVDNVIRNWEMVEYKNSKIVTSEDDMTDLGRFVFENMYINILKKAFENLSKSFKDVEFIGTFKGEQERVIGHGTSNRLLYKCLNNLFAFPEKDRISIMERVNIIIQYMGLGNEIVIEKFHQESFYIAYIIHGKKKINIADSGYGYSQLLPIIFRIGLLSYEDYPMLLLEEPEAHLHPKLQSKLADLLVFAINKYLISIVIETHSEYFIRKLQYLVAKGDIESNQLVIHYFQGAEDVSKSKRNSMPQKILINKDGSLTDDFGPGFYDEADTLAIDLFNFKKHQKN